MPGNTTSSTPATLERPKRPRTAYNYFFQDERQELLATLPVRHPPKRRGRGHGKIAFADMAKIISTKWKNVGGDRMIYYANLANQDKFRYNREMYEYRKAQRELAAAAATQQQPPSPGAPGDAFCSVAGGVAAATAADGDDFATFSDTTPVVFTGHAPSYADLARRFDKESIDFLVAALK